MCNNLIIVSFMRGLLPRQSHYVVCLNVETACAPPRVFPSCALGVRERISVCPLHSRPSMRLVQIVPLAINQKIRRDRATREKERRKVQFEEETRVTGLQERMAERMLNGLCKTERGSGGSLPINPEVAPSPLIFTS